MAALAVTGRRSGPAIKNSVGDVEVDTQSALLADLVGQLDRTGSHRRASVRVWGMSGVERISFASGDSLIFKWAREPFTAEADVLRHAHGLGVPVPMVLGSAVRDGVLGMLMEDLGTPIRVASADDAVNAAVLVHRTVSADEISRVDRAALAQLPGDALAYLDELRSGGRWKDTAWLDSPLAILTDHAVSLSDGAEMEPFGLCHSEFHPTSLHIGRGGWRLLDWARAFEGPGLLDLASWQGTQERPDPVGLRRLAMKYVRAGGSPDALRPRAGLLPEDWALGWHRVWALTWFLEQAALWMPDRSGDEFAASVVARHLKEAIALFGIKAR